jgi:hypothetical protein
MRSIIGRSELIWSTWLLLFLAYELTAKDVTGLAPWYSLSHTARWDEQTYPILRTLLFGFLIGLGVHIRYPVTLWRATLGGVLVAVVLNLIWTP